MFLNSRTAFKEYLGNVKKPFMANFYKKQRIKNKILVDDDKPIELENGVLMRKIEKNFQRKLICLKDFYQLELNILKI